MSSSVSAPPENGNYGAQVQLVAAAVVIAAVAAVAAIAVDAVVAVVVAAAVFLPLEEKIFFLCCS